MAKVVSIAGRLTQVNSQRGADMLVGGRKYGVGKLQALIRKHYEFHRTGRHPEFLRHPFAST